MKRLIEENYSFIYYLYKYMSSVILSKIDYIYFSFLIDLYIYIYNIKSKYNIDRRQMHVKRK